MASTRTRSRKGDEVTAVPPGLVNSNGDPIRTMRKPHSRTVSPRSKLKTVSPRQRSARSPRGKQQIVAAAAAPLPSRTRRKKATKTTTSPKRTVSFATPPRKPTKVSKPVRPIPKSPSLENVNIRATFKRMAPKELDKSLRKAAREDRLPSAIELLAASANPNSPDKSGKTPLMNASTGSPRIVDLLLKNGANPNTQDNKGNTALMIASEHSQEAIIEQLTIFNADANIRNKDGKTARDLYKCDVARFDRIIPREAPKRAKSVVVARPAPVRVPAARKEKSPVRSRFQSMVPKQLNKLLRKYSLDGRLPSVKELLLAGADINTRDRFGATPLMKASTGHDKIVEFLISKGADVNIADNTGKTSLMVASEKAQCNIIETLIKRGANVNATNYEGKTARNFYIGRPEEFDRIISKIRKR